MALISRIPNWKLLIILTIFAGLSEGIGMAALIPILSTISPDASNISASFPFNLIPNMFNYIGVKANFFNLLCASVLLICLTFIIIFLQEKLMTSSKYKFLNLIRKNALNRLIDSEWSYLSKKNSGDLSNILIHEAERSAEALTSLLMMIGLFIQFSLYLFLNLMLSWEMTLLSFVAIIVSGLIALKLISMIRGVAEKGVHVFTHYNRFIVETIRGSKLLKSTGVTREFLKNVHLKGNEVTSIKSKILVNQSFLKLILQIVILLSITCILFIGVKVLETPTNSLFLFLFILLRLSPKTFTFHAQYHNFVTFKPALEIVDKLINEAEQKIENSTFKFKKFSNSIKKLEFKNVSYSYDNNKMALDNINVSISNHKVIGIAGKSGSGKTTFVDICLGLLKPTKGIIQIGNTNLNEYNISDYRKVISYVPQEDIFFDGTIEENIKIGLKKINQSQIKKYLEQYNLDKMLESFPNGIKTRLLEGGTNLSGGQRQRIAIIRAILREPELLILDEATSALDNQVEHDFRKCFKYLSQKTTILIVAHRLSNLKQSDLILVFDNGKIVQKGKYGELINKNGIFKELIEIENKNV